MLGHARRDRSKDAKFIRGTADYRQLGPLARSMELLHCGATIAEAASKSSADLTPGKVYSAFHRVANGKPLEPSKSGRRPLLLPAEDKKLQEFMISHDVVKHRPLQTSDICMTAYQILLERKSDIPPTLPTLRWTQKYVKSHPALTNQTGVEPMDRARYEASTVSNLQTWACQTIETHPDFLR